MLTPICKWGKTHYCCRELLANISIFFITIHKIPYHEILQQKGCAPRNRNCIFSSKCTCSTTYVISVCECSYRSETEISSIKYYCDSHLPFLDARRSQRASLVIDFDLNVRVISNSFSSFGLLEVPCGSIGFFWVSWGPFGSLGFFRVP